ncbi:deoxyribodipyrimidine photo-lyase [Anopheles sinensis]|uniref:Deoxyribodipyrimidine photo-lyase n=1 Tax=Anopheles sinensis TaxID=74873 RepID=A0A084WNR1_ANOSI|nr:deoxyribodipyrimidine photo-lyase [Anopheles sinensis]
MREETAQSMASSTTATLQNCCAGARFTFHLKCLLRKRRLRWALFPSAGVGLVLQKPGTYSGHTLGLNAEVASVRVRVCARTVQVHHLACSRPSDGRASLRCEGLSKALGRRGGFCENYQQSSSPISLPNGGVWNCKCL